MARPQWTRLNREQAYKVLDLLGSRADAIVFSREVTEVSWRELPFYSRHKLLRLVNYATMPTFTMLYLSDGTEFISLDGSANPIYTVNEKDPIKLSAESVIPYLEFFFSNVHGSEGDVFLIKDPLKLPFMNYFTDAQQRSITSSFRPLRVEAGPEDMSFKVSGTLHYGGGLMAATIVVMNDGKIIFEDQSLLLSGIHFPDNPYTQTWIEG
jgi:hypothetical protein